MTTAVPRPKATTTVFAQAAEIFTGWTDPDTGLRVLRLQARGADPKGEVWSTPYHQFSCFLDGGRKVLLHRHPVGPGQHRDLLLDLTTGMTESPFPPGYVVREVIDRTRMATMYRNDQNPASPGGSRALIWDLQAQREVVGLDTGPWILNCLNMLSDGRRAIVYRHTGWPYREKIHGRHDLLTPGEPARMLLDYDGAHCSHVQSCPSDPELYTYDRWPSPVLPAEQVIRFRTLDGRLDEPMKMDAKTLRPGDTWGARDHYVWTPDSKRIVSYFCIHPVQPELNADFNHFKWEWWLSATDWRTGEDLSAMYPSGRWGGHMQVSPDSKWVICGGGPGFDKLFLVSIEGMRQGWNERVLCTYPKTVSLGKNTEPFPFPFALPDQSGVIFNAGWPGEEHGVYLCEWAKEG